MTAEPCPSMNELRGFVLGRVGDDVEGRIARHIECCDSCESMLQQFEDQSDVLLDVMCLATGQQGFHGEPECEQAVELAGTLAGDASLSADTIGRLVQRPLPASGKIRDYVLLEILGEGGMGTVYKAVHTRLQRPVALKVIRPDRTESPRAVDRFRREMQAVGRLDHPNIVRATDAGEADGVHFLVMELVDGENLSQLVQRHGPLSVADACEMIRQAAVGLEHAHQRGLVHRDVKPSNLMLTVAADTSTSHVTGEGAVVKILDLGLAWLTDVVALDNDLDAPSGAHTTVADTDFRVLPDADTDAIGQQQEVTLTTHVVGTRDYMAPEQMAKRRSLDRRADVYSLGATLHKLLWGQPPRHPMSQHPTDGEAVVDSPTIQDAPRKDVPEELSLIVSRMLNARPQDRLQNMGEVVAALEPFCRESDLLALLGKRCQEPFIGRRHRNDKRFLTPFFPPFFPLLAGLLLAGAVIAAIAFSLGSRDDDGLNSITRRFDEANGPRSGGGAAPVISIEQAEALKAVAGPPDSFALQFDGEHYVEIVGTSALSNTDATFTAELWIRPFHGTETSAWMGNPFFSRQVGKRLDESGKPVGWFLGYNYSNLRGSDRVIFYYGNRDVDSSGRQWNVNVPRRRWLHFAVCHRPDGITLFMNGRRLWVHVTQRPEKPPVESPSNIYLGCPNDDWRPKTCLADIRAFRLSDGIRYETKRFSPPVEFEKDHDTLVLLDFSKGEGNVIADLSGHGRHGNIVGARWIPVDVDPLLPWQDSANLAPDGPDAATTEPVMSITTLTEAIDRDPQNIEHYLLRSVQYDAQGRYDECIADCTEVLRIDPEHVDALYLRSEAYSSKRQFERAIADCNEVIRLAPNYFRAYGLRGVAYAHEGQFERAIADCDELIRLAPNEFKAYGSRGRTYRLQGEYAKAIVDFTEAIRLRPTNASLYYARGFCYRKMGDKVKAAADVAKAFQLGYKLK